MELNDLCKPIWLSTPIEVNKGENKDDLYAVDALSGATLTSNGVENSLQFEIYGHSEDHSAWSAAYDHGFVDPLPHRVDSRLQLLAQRVRRVVQSLLEELEVVDVV